MKYKKQSVHSDNTKPIVMNWYSTISSEWSLHKLNFNYTARNSFSRSLVIMAIDSAFCFAIDSLRLCSWVILLPEENKKCDSWNQFMHIQLQIIICRTRKRKLLFQPYFKITCFYFSFQLKNKLHAVTDWTVNWNLWYLQVENNK